MVNLFGSQYVSCIYGVYKVSSWLDLYFKARLPQSCTYMFTEEKIKTNMSDLSELIGSVVIPATVHRGVD